MKERAVIATKTTPEKELMKQTVPYLKLKNMKTDLESITDTNRLLWNYPYELPC